MNLRKTYFRLLVVPAALVILTSCTRTPACADMTLVDANTPPCPILVNAKDNPLEGRAATQLADYLEKISGKKFEVKAYAEPIPTRAIVIGEHGNAPLTQLGSDGFIIKTKGEQLFITGGGEQGTFYGVYDFLEKQLGCRFWSWNEEDVPQKAELKIGDLDIKEVPAFVMHDIMSKEAQARQNYFLYKSRALSTLQFTGGNHTMFKLLESTFKEHPEFLPMNDKGVRAFNNLHLNYLAPGIAQALADAIAKEVEKKNGNLQDWIYFAGQGDWYGGLDMSEESKKVYEWDGVTGPLIQMMNKTGAILEKKYPGIKVGTFAYMSTDGPPYKTIPGPNVNIWLPRLRYGTTLSIEEAASDKNPDEKSRNKMRAFKSNVEKWAEIAPGRLFIWEYGANYANFIRPWPSLRAMAENIKYYKKIGVTGVMIQGNYSSLGGDMAVLKNWIWSKLLWNPNQDVNALLKEFCDGYYGPSSSEMQEYVNVLEDSVRVPKYRLLDEFYGGVLTLPETLTRLTSAIDRAKAKTQSPANAEYLRRVKEAGVSIQLVTLSSRGPFYEKDGRLVADTFDFGANGNQDYSRANAVGVDLHPIAMEVAQNARGASGNEWSPGGRITQQQIIAGNGGPLYFLKHGAVTAKIAPFQGNQRLWEVSLGERKVIDHAAMFATGFGYFTPVGEPTNDKVEIVGEGITDGWDTSLKLTSHEAFSQDADGTLHWNGAFEIAKNKGDFTWDPRFMTSYPASSLQEAQAYAVEYKAADGWKPVPYSAKGTYTLPQGPNFEPVTELVIRVVTPDKRVLVTDTYRSLRGAGFFNCAWNYDGLYGKTDLKSKVVKCLNVYVHLKGDKINASNGIAPTFARSIKVEDAP
jgi:hypothetical protein